MSGICLSRPKQDLDYQTRHRKLASCFGSTCFVFALSNEVNVAEQCNVTTTCPASPVTTGLRGNNSNECPKPSLCAYLVPQPMCV